MWLSPACGLVWGEEAGCPGLLRVPAGGFSSGKHLSSCVWPLRKASLAMPNPGGNCQRKCKSTPGALCVLHLDQKPPGQPHRGQNSRARVCEPSLPPHPPQTSGGDSLPHIPWGFKTRSRQKRGPVAQLREYLGNIPEFSVVF